MPKVKVEILSESDCVTRSAGTDSFTQGWWYHATTPSGKKAILDGNVNSGFWLTQNPQGASQCNGKEVIRCRVLLNKHLHDLYNTKEANEGLDKGYRWIEVNEGSVFVAADGAGDNQPEPNEDAAASALRSTMTIRPIRERNA